MNNFNILSTYNLTLPKVRFFLNANSLKPLFSKLNTLKSKFSTLGIIIDIPQLLSFKYLNAKFNSYCFNNTSLKSIKNILNLFIKEFNIKNIKIETIQKALDKRLENRYPLENITESNIIGLWKSINEDIIFKPDGKGEHKFNNNVKVFDYLFEKGGVKVVVQQQKERFDVTSSCRQYPTVLATYSVMGLTRASMGTSDTL